MFGAFVKGKRLALDLSLREFSRLIQEDPSNWSKIERGVIAPPQSIEKLNVIAERLQLEKGGPDYMALLDEAVIGAGKIPDYVMSDETVLNALPAFLRTINSVRPTEEEIRRLIQRIKEGG